MYIHHKNVYKKQTTDSTTTSFAIYHGTYVSNVHAKYYGAASYGSAQEVVYTGWTDGRMDGRTQPIA